MILRDYQEFGVSALFRYFEENETGNPIIAMPTGTGKSLVIAGFLQEVFHRYAGQRVMCLTHVKELIQQNYGKLRSLWPSAPAGVYSAGLGRKEFYAPIVFAGIASAINCPEDFGRVDLVLIDECHLVSPKEGTMYQELIAALKVRNPFLRVIGLTATHYRLGQGALTEDGGLFTDVPVDMTTFDAFNWFLDEGYLCPLVPRPTKTELKVDGVKIQQGEYNLKQLQLAVDRTELTTQALTEACELASSRKSWLVFASGIEHMEHCCAILNDMGIAATFIHSKISGEERDKRLADYLAGRYQAMVNNGILTTGFDHPGLDCIIMLRPTMSPGLWVQMLGRGTRAVYAEGFDLTTASGRLEAIAASDKRNCLVLDFAGNTRRLGPINDPVLPRKKGAKKGTAPVKICEGCGCYCHASVRVCPNCQYVFPLRAGFKATASTDELIRRNAMPEIVSVNIDRITYKEHKKPGGVSSLKVSYHCGLRVFHEWVCLEHMGYALHRAHDWWREHSSTRPPESVADALKRIGELRQPRAVRVWINRQYPEVRGHEFHAAN